MKSPKKSEEVTWTRDFYSLNMLCSDGQNQLTGIFKTACDCFSQHQIDVETNSLHKGGELSV